MAGKNGGKKSKSENFIFSAWLRKYFWTLLGAITLLSLMARIALCFSLVENDPSVANPSSVTDMYTYKKLAEDFAKGQYHGEFYYQPFYYTVFLPILRIFFGDGIWPVMLAQSLLGAATVLLAGLTAGLLWGRTAALLAALFCGFSSVLLLYTPYHLIATLQAFWLTLLFWLCLGAMKKGGLLRWILVGLITGAAILTRGNVWLLVPGLIAAALWTGFRAQKRRDCKNRSASVCFISSLIPAALLLIFIILPQLPYAWHNSVLKGKLCGPSSAGGNVLALGNSPEAPPGGRNPGTRPGPMEYPPSYHAWMEADAKGEPVSGKILDWAKSEPLAFLELQFRKILLFWDGREIPNNIALEVNGAKAPIFRIIGIIPSSFLLVNALAALIVLLPLITKRRGALLLWYFVVAYWAATAAFYILCRFRAPLLPLLAVLSAGFIVEALRMVHAKRNRTIFLRFVPALIFGFFVVAVAYDIYRFNFEAAVMRVVRPDGVHVFLGSKGKELRLDNGPLSFGGWAFLSAKEGMLIEKRFAGCSRTDDKDTVSLILMGVWSTPGSATIEINGKEHAVKSKGEGVPMEEKFRITPQPDGSVSIKVIDLQGDMSFIADFQRDYGRTRLNGEPLGGELVARLYLETR
ncbi:MAG: hypothetical protein A2X49_01000 [Lentisphaerae bacterium GWF2_52_8]|nr:MAG: hypothetical protein A2X49_01000 [Lentisphaerae bacterium GWF2_52_8]